ncbi:MAG TPA: hypothetical protein VGQ41_19550 [Pyrinomonadaceae bacterium]|nr:hypothetical protein [Pyrinomonadaceae bacterium]
MSKLPHSIMRSITFGAFALLTLFSIAVSAVNCSHPISQCHAHPEPDLDWDDHLGPVESIRIEDAEMFYADNPLLRQISKFNPEGQKIEQVLYRDDGVALPKSTYSYDSMGRLTKAHHYQVNGSILLENTYTYNSDGTLKDDVQRRLDDNKVLSHKLYSNDLKRNLTEVSEFDWDTKLRGRFGFVRDGECRVIELFVYNPDGSVHAKVMPRYDDKNNVIETIVYSDNGAVLEKRHNDYEFDRQGNWIKQISSKWKVENGKGSYKSDHVTIRKITYY